jgi:hypothetical protein
MTTALIGPDSPEYKSPAYEAMRPRWQRVRDIRGGTETIQAMREVYLPRFEAEEMIDYNARLAMTFAFEALDETLLAMVGLATRNDPTLEDDVPPVLKEDWENLDGQRTHGAVFAQHVLESALQDGHAAILVDYPPADPTLDLAQQRAMDLRPYAVQITIDQITAWSTTVIQGKLCLGMVKLEERAEVLDGAYGTKTVTRYRTYRQSVGANGPYVTLEVQEEAKVGTATEYLITRPESAIRGPRWIPFFPVYGGKKTGVLISLPPLLGLANSNLDHTQVKSDRRYSMHKCAIPIPVFIGRTKTQGEGGKQTVGPSYGIDIGVGGSAMYMEPTGAALAALREELQDIERRMGSQGFDMLRREPGTDQTATASRIENTKGESKLSRAVRSLEDALESMLQAFADFRGLDQGGGSVTLMREFADTILTADEIRLLMDLEDRGELTLPTLLTEIQKGGRMLQGVDVDAEVAAVQDQMASEPVTPDPNAPPLPVPADVALVLNGAQPPAPAPLPVAA